MDKRGFGDRHDVPTGSSNRAVRAPRVATCPACVGRVSLVLDNCPHCGHPEPCSIVRALEDEDFDHAEALVRAGADPDAFRSDEDGVPYTPLTTAVRTTGICDDETYRRCLRLIDLLLSHGADPNRRATLGRMTPLHMAAILAKVEAVRALLDAGGRLDLLDGLGCTPLHGAVKDDGGLEVVKLLVSRGAPVNAADGRGRTPLDHAREWKAKGVARVLKDNGARRSNPLSRLFGS